MAKKFILPLFAAVLLSINGCGGSGSADGELSAVSNLAEYEANLPDGSPMVIEFLSNEGNLVEGEFVVGSETGDYAHQAGSFEGTRNGNEIDVICETIDGKEFHLTGSINGSKGLHLTRSDIPGTVLNFAPVAVTAPASRGELTFNFASINASGGAVSSGKVTISDSPSTSHDSGKLLEYRGNWMGIPCTFWAYSSGYANLVLNIDNLCIESANFANYPLKDFKTVTATGTGTTTSYNIATKLMVRFPGTVRVSP